MLISQYQPRKLIRREKKKESKVQVKFVRSNTRNDQLQGNLRIRKKKLQLME